MYFRGVKKARLSAQGDLSMDWLRLLDEVEHLAEANDVDRQRQQIQEERRRRASQRAVADEEDNADDADDAQRHDGPHHQSRDVEHSPDQRKHVGEIDVRQHDIEQPVEHHVVGDVGRVEAELDQQLLDAKILRRVFEKAIEYCRRIDIGAAHAVLSTIRRASPHAQVRAKCIARRAGGANPFETATPAKWPKVTVFRWFRLRPVAGFDALAGETIVCVSHRLDEVVAKAAAR